MPGHSAALVRCWGEGLWRQAPYRSIFLLLAAFFWTVSAQAESQTVRLATLKYGTIAWALDSMVRHGDDRAAGIRLRITGLAGGDATKIALQSGDADIATGDWVWVSRQRAAGKGLSFIPFSTAVGSLMVGPDSGIAAIPDLAGRRLGIAGGPLDKSWLFLQAVARQRHGLDLAKAVEPVFGAPPLLSQQLRQGRIDAVLTYWHYAARLRAAGYPSVLEVRDLIAELGGSGTMPVVGFIVDDAWARDHPGAVAGFVEALRRTQARLADDDGEWQELRPLMRPRDEAEFLALRDGFRVGIPGEGSDADMQRTAERIFAVLARLGGERLVGPRPALQPGTFWRPVE